MRRWPIVPSLASPAVGKTTASGGGSGDQDRERSTVPRTPRPSEQRIPLPAARHRHFCIRRQMTCLPGGVSADATSRGEACTFADLRVPPRSPCQGAGMQGKEEGGDISPAGGLARPTHGTPPSILCNYVRLEYWIAIPSRHGISTTCCIHHVQGRQERRRWAATRGSLVVGPSIAVVHVHR